MGENIVPQVEAQFGHGRAAPHQTPVDEKVGPAQLVAQGKVAAGFLGVEPFFTQKGERLLGKRHLQGIVPGLHLVEDELVELFPEKVEIVEQYGCYHQLPVFS